MKARILSALFLILSAILSVQAQTTAFTYQGRLNDSTATPPVTGSYDFQFSLFDNVGNQIGATLTKTNVQVSVGVFSVGLDFNSNPFTAGEDRFLQIAVKRTTDSSFIILSPRQQLTSVPFAVQTLNAAQLGGFPANQFVQTTDSRLTDAREPIAGSGNYIQNSPNQQAATFNISGNGTLGGNLSANSVAATTNFKIGNTVIFSMPNSTSVAAGQFAGHTAPGVTSTYFGYKAGQSVNNAFTFANTFIGSEAGQANTSGHNNTFVGKNAGFHNTIGAGNSYFGADAGAGQANTNSNYNSFFGFQAGWRNSGSRNSFFGTTAGQLNTSASDNSFFGYEAGILNKAAENSFFGSGAGNSNTNGIRNSFFGKAAGGSNTTGFRNAFFGAGAGVANTSGGENSAFGEGAGAGITTGEGNSALGFEAGAAGNFNYNTVVGYQAGGFLLNVGGNNNTFIGANAKPSGNVTNSTAIGANAVVHSSNTIVLGTMNEHVLIPGAQSVAGTAQFGNIKMNALSAGSGSHVCRDSNQDNRFVACDSSSLRYKTNVENYTGGIDVVRRLRPVSFDWKQTGVRDIGFAAEEVAEADAQLVIRDEKGQIEGVKYDRISLALVNAVKEQQTKIEQQQKQIEELRAIVCGLKPDAAVCADLK